MAADNYFCLFFFTFLVLYQSIQDSLFSYSTKEKLLYEFTPNDSIKQKLF